MSANVSRSSIESCFARVFPCGGAEASAPVQQGMSGVSVELIDGVPAQAGRVGDTGQPKTARASGLNDGGGTALLDGTSSVDPLACAMCCTAFMQCIGEIGPCVVASCDCVGQCIGACCGVVAEVGPCLVATCECAGACIGGCCEMAGSCNNC